MTNLMSSSERPGNKIHEGLEERGEPTTGQGRLRTGRAQAKLHPEMGIRDTRKVANHMDLLSLANFYNEMKLNTIGDYIISTGEAQRRNSEDAVPVSHRRKAGLWGTPTNPPPTPTSKPVKLTPLTQASSMPNSFPMPAPRGLHLSVNYSLDSLSESRLRIPMDGYGAMEDRESGRALQQNNILPEIRTRGKSLPPSRGSDS